jgi:hypothetical protein
LKISLKVITDDFFVIIGPACRQVNADRCESPRPSTSGKCCSTAGRWRLIRPAAEKRRNIGMIFQEFNLIEQFLWMVLPTDGLDTDAEELPRMFTVDDIRQARTPRSCRSGEHVAEARRSLSGG